MFVWVDFNGFPFDLYFYVRYPTQVGGGLRVIKTSSSQWTLRERRETLHLLTAAGFLETGSPFATGRDSGLVTNAGEILSRNADMTSDDLFALFVVLVDGFADDDSLSHNVDVVGSS